MCGRYYIAADDNEDEICELIDEVNCREKEKSSGKTVKTGEIFPGDEALVVTNSRAQRVRPFLMRWGFEGDGRLLINARSETAGQKATFAPLLRERRLLVPASGYFEWEKRGRERVKYTLTAAGGVSYMAGLYRINGDRAEFVILTREAAPDISFIHPRMPVILRGDAAKAWLRPDSDPEQVLALAEQEMRFEAEEGRQISFDEIMEAK